MSDAARVQAYLRGAAIRHRDVVRVPGFTCAIDPHDDLRYLNYAIPDGEPDDPAAVREAFAARARLPRFEFVVEAAPWLEERLRAAGFREELRTPLMTCTPATLAAVPLPPGAAIESVGDVRALLEVQRPAFGDARPVTDDDVARWTGIAVLARLDGRPVGGAGCTEPGDGLSEIVGVAVAEDARRRGLGAALTAAATREAFARGADVAFLTPGDADTERIYARVGFTRSLTVLAASD